MCSQWLQVVNFEVAANRVVLTLCMLCRWSVLQAGGKVLDAPAVEITYGLERILMSLQGVKHFKDIRCCCAVRRTSPTAGIDACSVFICTPAVEAAAAAQHMCLDVCGGAAWSQNQRALSDLCALLQIL